MDELLALLKDGRSRTVEMLADELNTTAGDVLRKIDFLERSGIIRRVATSFPKSETIRTAGRADKESKPCSSSCSSCAGCSHKGTCGSKVCKSCMPEDGFKNMGVMWEVV